MLQPNTVSASTRATELFRQNGGIMRMAEIVRSGITRNTLYAMRDSGQVEQLARGLYRLADLPSLSQSDLVTVASKVEAQRVVAATKQASSEMRNQ